MFVGLLFWFQFYCGFSASAMIDQWYLIFFNLLFSSLPQLVTGVLDKDVPAHVLLAEPWLYRSGQSMEVRASRPASPPFLHLPGRASPQPPWDQFFKFHVIVKNSQTCREFLFEPNRRQLPGGKTSTS